MALKRAKVKNNSLGHSTAIEVLTSMTTCLLSLTELANASSTSINPAFCKSQIHIIRIYPQGLGRICSTHTVMVNCAEILFQWTECNKRMARCARSSERAATCIYHEEYDDRAQQHPGCAGGGVAEVRPHGLIAGSLQNKPEIIARCKSTERDRWWLQIVTYLKVHSE